MTIGLLLLGLRIILDCSMNSLGRHYRDQRDTSNPTCNYDNCNFFASGSPFADIPYPSDISLGPVGDSSPPSASSNQQADLSLIMQMLQEQRENSARTNAQMLQLQNQMNSILAPTTVCTHYHYTNVPWDYSSTHVHLCPYSSLLDLDLTTTNVFCVFNSL